MSFFTHNNGKWDWKEDAKGWGGLILGALFFVVAFSPGLLSPLFDRKEPPVAESACRGTASSYESPFDGNTYTYSCGSDGIWQFTDRFNNPGCQLIKGNIAFESKEKIYHVKGQAYYDDTKIDLEYGERWFCSEQEAIEAGWRKSYE